MKIGSIYWRNWWLLMNNAFFKQCESWQRELLNKEISILDRGADEIFVREVSVVKKRDEFGAPRFLVISENGEEFWPERYARGFFDGAHGLLFLLNNSNSTIIQMPKYYFVCDDEYEDKKSASEFENIFRQPDEQTHEVLRKGLKSKIVPFTFILIPLLILSDILGICLSVFTEPGEFPVLLGIEGLAILLIHFLSIYFSHQSIHPVRRRIQICGITIAAAFIEIIDYGMMIITRDFLPLIIVGYVLCLIGHAVVILLLTSENRLLAGALSSRKYYVSPATVLEPVRQWVHGKNVSVAYHRYYIRVMTESGKVFRVHSTRTENKKMKEGAKGDLVCVRKKDASKIFFLVLLSSLAFGLLGCGTKDEDEVWGGTLPPSDMFTTSETEPPRDHLELSLDLVHVGSDGRDYVLLFDEWEENETVAELMRRTRENPLELDLVYMDDYAIAGELGFTLPSNDVEMTVYPNDVVLFEGNKILICNKQHTGNYKLLTHGKG